MRTSLNRRKPHGKSSAWAERDALVRALANRMSEALRQLRLPDGSKRLADCSKAELSAAFSVLITPSAK